MGVITVGTKNLDSFGFKYNYGTYRYGYDYLNQNKDYLKERKNFTYKNNFLKKIKDWFIT